MVTRWLVAMWPMIRPLNFFFQAEDGIRDVAVTGVQTCALPIWPAPVAAARPGGRTSRRGAVAARRGGRRGGRGAPRSEERRVGKGCSCARRREAEQDSGVRD